MIYHFLFVFQNKRGLVLVRTATLLLVATYGDNMFPSVCVEATEKLGRFIDTRFITVLIHGSYCQYMYLTENLLDWTIKVKRGNTLFLFLSIIL